MSRSASKRMAADGARPRISSRCAPSGTMSTSVARAPLRCRTMRRTTSFADYGTRDGSVIEQETVILWMLLPPFLDPVYWAVAVEQPDGTFDTVMLPSPAGTASTV